MVLDLRKQDLLKIVGLQSMLARPKRLQILVVAVGVERVRTAGIHRKKDMRSGKPRIEKPGAGGGKVLVRSIGTMDSEAARQAVVLKYPHLWINSLGRHVTTGSANE